MREAENRWPVCFTLAPSTGARLSFVGRRLAWVPAALPRLAHAAAYLTAGGRIVVEAAHTDHTSRICTREVAVFDREAEAAAWLARVEPEAGARVIHEARWPDPGAVP